MVTLRVNGTLVSNGPLYAVRSVIQLINDASFTLPDSRAGFGFFQAGNGAEYMQLSWADDATAVTVINGSLNTANSDSVGDFCAYKVGNQVTIKNRLGTTQKIAFEYFYYKP
jgi:hypothetical protein